MVRFDHTRLGPRNDGSNRSAPAPTSPPPSAATSCSPVRAISIAGINLSKVLRRHFFFGTQDIDLAELRLD